jgi:hypothetical protein
MASTLLSTEDYLRVLLLVLPLIVGGVLHMIIVKKDILSYLKKPIHQRWFGSNKTWRGFVVMPLATWPGVILAQSFERSLDLSAPLLTLHSSFFLALVLGFAYCLAELPNSYLKRRLGIKEGQTSEKNKALFIILDQADSATGCLLAYKLVLGISWPVFWATILIGMAIHFVINLLLYSLQLRKNPF